MRYLINDQYYNQESGPILFYAGNEGSVTTFYENSGFMTTTLAQELGAMVVFAEHRYYGTSMPFGDKSFDNENLRYLTIEQVMYDYISLLKQIKSEHTELADRATIAFGGSYGGMLAAWMRMKYPQHIQGAVASSAPILWFKGSIDPNSYTIIAGQSIKKAGGQTCYDSILRGFFDMTNLKLDSSKYSMIDEIFNTCDNSKVTSADDVQGIMDMVSDSLGTMAMVNYPYETNFTANLPAWPISEACKASAAVTPQEKV